MTWSPSAEYLLSNLRKYFGVFSIGDPLTDWPVLVETKEVRLYTFSSSVINRTLSWLLDKNRIEHSLDDTSSCFILEISFSELKSRWETIIASVKNLDPYLEEQLIQKPLLMSFSKWGGHLPLSLKIELFKQRQLDVDSLASFANIRLIENKAAPEDEFIDAIDITAFQEMPEPVKVAEYDDLSFRKFTSRSEADKAINSLKGILLGISMDGVVNTAELNELKLWCTRHAELIDRNPFKEFMMLIQDALQEESNRVEVVHDLFWLCQKYESDSTYYNAATTDLQILQGICHGILADGVVDDDEVMALDKWLVENEYLASYYPYDEIRSLVASVLEDGVIDDDERKQLLAYFNEFVNLNDKQLTQTINEQIAEVLINGICSVNPQLIFEGKNFCFTGVSKRAKRSDIEKQVLSLGGIFHSNVIKNTHYLIIGDGGNPCWAYACYGRKVETAVNLRKQGHQITLVNEMDFWNKIENN